MSFFNKIVLPVLVVALLTACDHQVNMVTDVHADGSLDKTIVLESKAARQNMLGVGPHNGWDLQVDEQDTVVRKLDSAKKYKITLHKRFASAAGANADLAAPSDTLLRITSTFDKQFRWFYTYIYYADTYHALNRLPYPIDDYLAKEDYEFIERLPAEGKPMSKADSLYLAELNRKLFDIYGLSALFEQYYAAGEMLLRQSKVDASWLDTLRAHKGNVLERVRGDKAGENDFMVPLMDSLGIPLPQGASKTFDSLIKPTLRIVDFISLANDGEYHHVINMPWDVVRTNADSVAGRSLHWNPPTIKFLVKDYTMYAESRQMNYWAVGVSVLLVGFTVYLFVRRRPG